MTWEVRLQGSRVWLVGWSLVALIASSRGFALGSKPAPAERNSEISAPAITRTNSAANVEMPDLIFVQAAKVKGDFGRGRFPEGSRLVRMSGKPAMGELTDLTPDFFAAADPQISFDAERVMFSGQKARTDRWQVWEMRTDGTERRQITDCSEDCFHPIYLPDDELGFAAATAQGQERASYLAVAKLDGSNRHRITFGPGNWRIETVLRDGRIVASATSPLTEDPTNSQPRLFYTMRPDGTALDSLRCEHTKIAFRGEASESEDGSLIFTQSGNAGQFGGALMEIEQGNLSETEIGQTTEKYSSPRMLSAEKILVARKAKSAEIPDGRFDLYLVDTKQKSTAQRVYSDTKLNSIQAVPIAKHIVPKKYWSMVNSESKAGYLIALDSYSSVDDKSGRIATPIAKVRVWTLQAGVQKDVALGEAPVEKDGSFYVEVPADQPVRFELLDDNGRTIRLERGWVWSRAGEQRGCAGCHSDKAVAPENRWPMTLKRFDTPTQFGEKQGPSEGTHAN